ncbi:MAG: DNA-directed RNA polymerase subunit alpha [Chloroflexi bacterium]|nr:DNA-directed RNA polymerase subunit alpha [Chloroflexota bacterium]
MLDIILPKITPITTSDDYGRYQIEPLEPGYGVTLGNALRRVLLSSLPGAAITSVKIDGIYHEFSDVPHVKEDTIELVLNLKQLRLRMHTDRPTDLVLQASGSGRVTAADIVAPPEVEIVNPELHIATLDSPEARLSIEMTVEKGKGYVPADHRDGLAIGVIPVDTVFTPVRKVNFAVEHTRVGQVTDYDRLVLEVWTDGTITPNDALSQSADILVRHLNLLLDLAAKPAARPERQPLAASIIPSKIYDIPIEDLDLSVRAYNCLKRAGITKVGQVLEMSEDDLLGVRNFGRKSLEELREKLEQRGFIEGSRLALSEAAARSEEEREEEPEERDIAEEAEEGTEEEEEEEAEELAEEEKEEEEAEPHKPSYDYDEEEYEYEEEEEEEKPKRRKRR